MASPILSVILPAYNADKYIDTAIRSILSQTFSDFEFIIIDDGSTDQTPTILDGYSNSRIRRITYDRNHGIVKALHQGIKAANGKYIARMDADDIALPDRFERQLSHLQKNSDVGVLGTFVELIDETGRSTGMRSLPVRPHMVHWNLLFGNPIIHPSIMARKHVIEKAGSYDPKYAAAEDFYLWQRVSQFSKLANLPEVLLQYRIHPATITSGNNQNQWADVVSIELEIYAKLGVNKVDRDLLEKLLRSMAGVPSPEKGENLRSAQYVIKCFLRYFGANRLPNKMKLEIAIDTARKLFQIAYVQRKLMYPEG